MMKEAAYTGCFCSARQESLPEMVRAQIYFELCNFEMVQHILLSWKTWSIFFPSFQTEELLVLCMFLPCYQVMYISRGAILGTRSIAKEQLKRHSWLTLRKCNEIKCCRSLSNYQSAELQF